MPRVNKIVDLSHALQNGTVVYPGDPIVQVSTATTVEADGYNLSYVNIGSQSGTHVDAPYHFRNDGPTVDLMDLNLFMGNGLILEFSGKKPEESITLGEILPFQDKIKKADIVLFRTDWYKYEHQDIFLHHPYLSGEAGKYLLDSGIKTLASDAINLDQTGGTEFPVHEMYSRANGIIAENLANLDQVDFENPFIVFLPLNLTGVDGSPVRAVAIDFA